MAALSFAPSTGSAAAARPPASRLRQQRLVLGGAAIICVSITLLQRIGYVMSDSAEVPLCLATGYLGIAFFAASGRLRVDTVRLWLFGVALGAMILTLFVEPRPFSPFSLFYLLALYLPFTLSLTLDEPDYLDVLKIFQNCLILPAAVAILQFALNQVGQQFPPFIDWLPSSFVLTGYNTHPVIAYGSAQIRANGEFFLEPSFVSQFMAFGILIEALWLGRRGRMALYGGALIASLSGTGLILLGGFGAAVIIRRRRYFLLAALLLGGALAIHFVHNQLIDALLGRVDEYATEDSSAFMRFIAPLIAIHQALGNSFATWLAGLGPGMAKDVQLLGVEFNPFVAAKLMIEYGLIGTIPFLVFVTYCFFVRTYSGLLKTATWFAYMLLSGSLQQPHTVLLSLMLTVLFRPPSRAGPELAPPSAAAAAPRLFRRWRPRG